MSPCYTRIINAASKMCGKKKKKKKRKKKKKEGN